MAKVNFRQQKRQKELARKERQLQRLVRRGERAPDEPATALATEAPQPTSPEIPPGEAQ